MSKLWSRPAFPFTNILPSDQAEPGPTLHGSTRAPNRGGPQPPQRLRQSQLETQAPSTLPDDPMGEDERQGTLPYSWDDPGYQADIDSPSRFVDPRRHKKRAPSERKAKSYQEKLLHSMVRNYLVSKNLLPKNDEDTEKAAEPSCPIPSLPPTPDPVVVGAYLAFQHQGPSSENVLIHWKAPMSHLWNARAIQLLVSGFESYAQDKQLVKLVELLGANITNGEIGKQLDEISCVQDLIEHKLTSRRNILRSVLRKVDGMTATMNATEISAALQINNELSMGRSRRKERKKLKFLRRDAIIEEAILLPKNYQSAENAKKWEDIKVFFSYLGVAEMSTDESETEGTFAKAKTLRRVRKYWLNPTASNVLHYIDSQYSTRKISGALKRGAAPLVRVHLAKKVNCTDTPPSELPLNFYGPDISPAALEVLAPGPAVHIPVVPTFQQVDDQIQVEVDGNTSGKTLLPQVAPSCLKIISLYLGTRIAS